MRTAAPCLLTDRIQSRSYGAVAGASRSFGARWGTPQLGFMLYCSVLACLCYFFGAMGLVRTGTSASLAHASFQSKLVHNDMIQGSSVVASLSQRSSCTVERCLPRERVHLVFRESQGYWLHDGVSRLDALLSQGSGQRGVGDFAAGPRGVQAGADSSVLRKQQSSGWHNSCDAQGWLLNLTATCTGREATI
eukprot:TRINITY_DN5780_c0_g1_i6.p1 TRINITY_DN5780_c0_g1~~TRINITY_DN5780_c0_g1_i6.p1  ORF type:complete len:192 (-),score=13.13 TRINITY_DN5780_c0_g1_i6:122-697(-)